MIAVHTSFEVQKVPLTDYLHSKLLLTHVGQQRGPVISRMIMHKWHLGEIDGLTLVYSSIIGEWKKISEVDILKEAISKMAKEEQIGEGVYPNQFHFGDNIATHSHDFGRNFLMYGFAC